MDQTVAGSARYLPSTRNSRGLHMCVPASHAQWKQSEIIQTVKYCNYCQHRYQRLGCRGGEGWVELGGGHNLRFE